MRVGQLLARRLSSTQTAVALVVSVALVWLLVSGFSIAALALLGVLILIATARRPQRTERYREAAVFPHTCEVVWALIKPAENSPIIHTGIRRGYHVPGTPDGLGERQAHEGLDGTTTVMEVVEYDPNRRAVTCQVSPPATVQSRTIQSVLPVEGGCEYTIGIEIDVASGHETPREYEEIWRAWARDHIGQIRGALPRVDPSL